MRASRSCSRLWNASARSWRPIQARTRRASSRPATARRSCAASAAETPQGRGTGRVRTMAARKTKKPAAVGTLVVMRLYIAEGAPNSVKAIANLKAICEKHLAEGFKLEVIDVLEFPLRTLA